MKHATICRLNPSIHQINPMKTIYINILLTLILFNSCNKEITSDSFPVGLENDFKMNEVYHSTNNSLEFSITEISDSRCPSDVECIWAGKADVRINVESPVEGIVVLSTIETNTDQKIDTLGNYSFQLIGVYPYPISTRIIKLEDYIVTLKIEDI